MNVPFVVNSSTMPPEVAWFAKVTNSVCVPLTLRFWTLNAGVAARETREKFGSVKLPIICQWLLKTSMLPLFWSAAYNWGHRSRCSRSPAR